MTTTAPRRRLCAHADNDGRGMHWLAPGETCTARTGQQTTEPTTTNTPRTGGEQR